MGERPHAGDRVPTKALHGGVQGLGILPGVKVWEIVNGATVLGTLGREKGEGKPLTLALNGAPSPNPPITLSALAIGRV